MDKKLECVVVSRESSYKCIIFKPYMGSVRGLTLSWEGSEWYACWAGVGKFTSPYFFPQFYSKRSEFLHVDSTSDEEQQIILKFLIWVTTSRQKSAVFKAFTKTATDFLVFTVQTWLTPQMKALALFYKSKLPTSASKPTNPAGMMTSQCRIFVKFSENIYFMHILFVYKFEVIWTIQRLVFSKNVFLA